MFTFVAVVKACVAACGGEVAHEQQEKDGPKNSGSCEGKCLVFRLQALADTCGCENEPFWRES